MKKGRFILFVSLLITLNSTGVLAQNYAPEPQTPYSIPSNVPNAIAPLADTPAPPPSIQPTPNAQPKVAPQYTISITSPTPEQTFQSGESPITVTVAVNPSLDPADTVVIFVDGAAATNPVSATSIILPALERGEHTLQAKIIQPGGAGAQSSVITIFQQRTSVLVPNTRG